MLGWAFPPPPFVTRVQLSAIVRQWVRRPDAPAEEPAAFAAFLAVKARRPHRSLERALDWVLWVYRTLWPVLVRNEWRERERGRGAPGQRRGTARGALSQVGVRLPRLSPTAPTPSLSFTQMIVLVVRMSSRGEAPAAAGAPTAAAAAPPPSSRPAGRPQHHHAKAPPPPASFSPKRPLSAYGAVDILLAGGGGKRGGIAAVR